MRHKDGLYFAPGVRFLEVRTDADDFPSIWVSRIEGFYLEPARFAARAGDGFAAGILALVALDAIARIATGGGVGKRFRSFAREHLVSFNEPARAEALYEQFRNGLVHEGRVKQGAELSLDSPTVVDMVEDVWRVNPGLLIDEISSTRRQLIRRNDIRKRIRKVVALDLQRELEIG